MFIKIIKDKDRFINIFKSMREPRIDTFEDIIGDEFGVCVWVSNGYYEYVYSSSKPFEIANLIKDMYAEDNN